MKMQEKLRKRKNQTVICLSKTTKLSLISKILQKSELSLSTNIYKMSSLLKHSIVGISSDDEEGVPLEQSTPMKFFPFIVLQALNLSAESTRAKQ